MIRTRPLAPSLFALVGLLSATGYFAYHGLFGENGWRAARALDEAIAERTRELAYVEAERAALERDAALLSTDRVNRDMLDERVRDTFGYARPDEIVILKRDLPAQAP